MSFLYLSFFCSWPLLQVSSRGVFPLTQWLPGSLPTAMQGELSPIMVIMDFYWIPLSSYCKYWPLSYLLNITFFYFP